MARLPGIDTAFGVLQGRVPLRDAVDQLAGAASTLAGTTGQLAGALGTLAAGVAGDAVGGVADAARAGAELVADAREAVQAFQRLALRADAIVAELEEPLLALAPGLRRLAAALDDPVVDELPATLRQVQEDVLPVLRTLADTHERVAFIAGQTERIMTFVDDTSRSLASLPGAALLGRRRPAPRVITIEQDPPRR